MAGNCDEESSAWEDFWDALVAFFGFCLTLLLGLLILDFLLGAIVGILGGVVGSFLASIIAFILGALLFFWNMIQKSLAFFWKVMAIVNR